MGTKEVLKSHNVWNDDINTQRFFKLEFVNHFRVCHFTYDSAKEVSLKTVILD